LVKGSKDSDSSLVSNENFSEKFWASGWALGQVTWAKMAQILLDLWCHSQKICPPETPNQNIFFECRLEDLPNVMRVWTAL